MSDTQLLCIAVLIHATIQAAAIALCYRGWKRQSPSVPRSCLFMTETVQRAGRPRSGVVQRDREMLDE